MANLARRHELRDLRLSRGECVRGCGREIDKAQTKYYCTAHLKGVRADGRKNYERNREKMLESTRRWRKNNLHKGREYSKRYYYRKFRQANPNPDPLASITNDNQPASGDDKSLPIYVCDSEDSADSKTPAKNSIRDVSVSVSTDGHLDSDGIYNDNGNWICNCHRQNDSTSPKPLPNELAIQEKSETPLSMVQASLSAAIASQLPAVEISAPQTKQPNPTHTSSQYSRIPVASMLNSQYDRISVASMLS